ncbi:hypothetical protein SLEP1_g33996 [Rubroshorea leprosula]|uniref:C2H2-type domain-containing protein n=1 Tax=Rubroshorea leprosula TaxID=152421 RepID=A0AAV5KIE3_9ROSI|nr:hypothetical protein SLEP1_g33996 [Rubroshorea leprosula]
MEMQCVHNLLERRCITKVKTPAVKWFREWVPQDIVATGGRCKLLKWVNENTLKALKEKAKEPEAQEIELEPTTEVLFLCSYEGCGKTFIDAGTLRKHSHIHEERQYFCHYEGCGKKFLDSSKLKRHFLIHTGEKHFVCPVKGCGKAFSLDFNLRSHMKTHSQENYHICPYPDCGKRYAHEYKLKNHIASQHEKNVSCGCRDLLIKGCMEFLRRSITFPNMFLKQPSKYPFVKTNSSLRWSSCFIQRTRCPGSLASCFHSNPAVDATKYATPLEKISKATKSSGGGYGSAASADRPYACPYEGCEKAYIHEYKLKLHLKREHPGHVSDENAAANAENEMDEASDQDAYAGKRVTSKSQRQQSRAKPTTKMPPSKVARKVSTSSPVALNVTKKPWPLKEEVFEEEDSEETEEDQENGDDGWRYGENNEKDDEETEYED